ncbi:thymidine phosphorylase [Rhodohalobacter mucosus]|uniref:thymidine phosphorylase n=1 Tax=Rhodohalobacter mucosus TaxID=2079485 RepID=A0A316TPL0_9BACT|nr:thymidine phosphorylase [Rhodohalobacter mucosus]PWN05758.1 thymidine phosphorylase [Rhodohalobacter mucosus]
MAGEKFNAVTLIRKKRDKGTLTSDEIRFLIRSYTEDSLPDYQMSAFLMACYLNGLNTEEAAALTKSMLHSGIVLDLNEVPGLKVDKHSTGGVGDKLSLILAPIVAACGVPVPMISGRGLGHTGGTLDKLESIPGFTVDMTLDRYREILKKHHLVLAGQTEDIAPADKRLYALRDVTATVESIPLIAGSIMSKKLAEGIDALVLDVKFGSGAFMKNKENATELARTLVNIGEEFGKETIAYLTNMDQPLGYAVGNWLEVRESIDALQGDGPEDVMEITHLLAGTMIYLGDKADSVDEGVRLSRQAVSDGSAMEKWIDIVKEQGGDAGMIMQPESYKKADYIGNVTAQSNGYITEMDTFALGMVAVELGAGRREKDDSVDPAAGFMLHKKTGDTVKQGETIAVLHTNKKNMLDAAGTSLLEAITINDSKPAPKKLITHRIDKKGVHEYAD